MQNKILEMGELTAVYRANWNWVWYTLFCLPFLLLLIVIPIAFYFDDYERQTGSYINIAIFYGIFGLLFLLIARAAFSEYKKWAATRYIRLKVYESGFIFEDEAKTLVCQWSDIKDINYATMTKSGRGPVGYNVSVVRSIIRSDGEVIVIPETLNRLKLTGAIKNKLREFKNL